MCLSWTWCFLYKWKTNQCFVFSLLEGVVAHNADPFGSVPLCPVFKKNRFWALSLFSPLKDIGSTWERRWPSSFHVPSRSENQQSASVPVRQIVPNNPNNPLKGLILLFDLRKRKERCRFCSISYFWPKELEMFCQYLCLQLFHVAQLPP